MASALLLGQGLLVGIAIGGVVLTLLLLVLSTRFLRPRFQRPRFQRHSVRDWMRLDWFLPDRARAHTKRTLSNAMPPAGADQIASTPDPPERSVGLYDRVRRVLRWFGPTWVASPFRRLIQTLCFATFFWLFFVVCWPYDARPEPPGGIGVGWRFEEIDQQSGELRFQSDQKADWWPEAGDVAYLVMDGASELDIARGLIDAFNVSSVDSGQIVLQPKGELPIEALDAVLTHNGTWQIHEIDPGRWPSHYADELAAKERVPAELFLLVDPLVSISTAIAARHWVWSLSCAAIILIVCLLIPRAFCGYFCPLGTLIDLVDWAVLSRVRRFRVGANGWWVHLKYYLLAATLVCAVFGVLISGYVSAIPVITRAALFIGEPLQTGLTRGWHLVPAMNAGQLVSVLLFVGLLGLGLFKPRFWCKYVCPSGAVFSLGNLLRITERKVESTCIHCNKCVKVCPFDAIKPDYTTRQTDCTFCQTCGGVCPTQAIKFVERWNRVELKVANDPPTEETLIGRRGFLALGVGATAAMTGGYGVAMAIRSNSATRTDRFLPVRPPGSVPEPAFLDMCIRCGECFKVCPNNVLQAEGLQQGLDGLWTPMVKADWAGCEASCNACGHVCPTGAIRALPLEEKRVARMGLAIVNQETCLPLAGRDSCDLCVDECNAAGYRAIQYTRVGTSVDDDGKPIEGTGFLAPVVLPDKCVGCGLCQTRCFRINVKEKHLLEKSAIIVEAGEGKEDRMLSGSYRKLREQEALQRAADRSADSEIATEFYVPDEPAAPAKKKAPDQKRAPEKKQDSQDDDPFGTGFPG